jgi:tripartite-type tricarboxylate transporter receptor subunit TctC
MTTAYPYILVVKPSLGVKTVAELVTLAKSKPGQLNYGTAGVGVSNHLVTELFDDKAGNQDDPRALSRHVAGGR